MSPQAHSSSTTPVGASSPSKVNGEEAREKLLKKTEEFFRLYNLRLKARKLPLLVEENGNDATSSNGNSSNPTHTQGQQTLTHTPGQQSSQAIQQVQQQEFPIYHFVNRQKRHLTEQLLRNRSSYETEFNTIDSEINKHTPFILKNMPESVKEHLQKMAHDFDDPEFSGVWLSVHTQPYVSDSEFGHLVRSKIVAWALIEVLTTNERCLKALWVHPKLGATATSHILRGFLPRVALEAFDLRAPQTKDTCPWKFFYSWLNDFDMLPRQTWLLLCAEEFFSLPKHCDNLGESAESEYILGHIDDGTPVGSNCPCQRLATWDDWDQILVGCTETYMYQRINDWLKIVPDTRSDKLSDEVEVLPSEDPDKWLKVPRETSEEIEQAEFFGLNRRRIAELLRRVYGKWCNGRVRDMDELLLTAKVEETNESVNDDASEQHMGKRQKVS